MPLSKELIREVRHLDEYDLRRLTIFVRGLLLARDAEPLPGDDVLEPPGPRLGKVTYREERVRCGREGCAKCPHGPYWYAYWREDGKLRSRYIGKDRPAEPAT